MSTIIQIIAQSKWSLLMKSSTYIDFGVENNGKNPKFEVVEYEIKNILAKSDIQIFVIKIKILCHEYV